MKAVLVTGATRNIGLAIARRFRDDGCAVAVNGIDAADVAAAADELGVHGVVADVADPDAVAAMTADVAARFGRLDVLVNNAALPNAGRVPLLDLALGDWDASFAVNVRGTMLCTVTAARTMRPGAAIVNISSIGATRAHRHAVAYDATKGAVEAATRAMALDLAPHGIRVNAVAPGAVATDRFDALDDATRDARAGEVPLGRVATGADIAAAVAFLAGSDAAYITGQVLAVDGGLTAQARTPAPAPTSEGSTR